MMSLINGLSGFICVLCLCVYIVGIALSVVNIDAAIDICGKSTIAIFWCFIIHVLTGEKA